MDKNKIKELPKSAGIYLFKNKDNEIIYVGKAKSIRSRVRSYFLRSDTFDLKTRMLVEELVKVDHIITKNEEEALLLEAKIIQDKKPRYNLLLKNGQPFIYFLFTNEEIPKMKLVRNKNQKGTYFGPFLRKQEVRKIYEFLNRTFRLKICKQKIPTGCLDYHMQLCSGICTDKFNLEDYRFRFEIIKKILSGNHKNLHEELKNQIVELNKRLEFERSKILFEYLTKLDHVIEVVKTHFHDNKYATNIAHVSSKMSQESINPAYIGKSLQSLLNLTKEPIAIDCFDISHFQSQSIVGSCIRFTNGVPEKNKFRRFKIKTLTTQNDYAALQEIVSRRYRNPEELPDLIVIDGGKGQLNAVKSLFPEATFVSIAKKEEILYKSNDKDGIHLDIKTPEGKLLIALRDYAHHFAINYYRKKHRQSPLV